MASALEYTVHAAEHDRSDVAPRRLAWLDRPFETALAIPIAEQLTLVLPGLGQPPVTAEQRASIQVLAVRRRGLVISGEKRSPQNVLDSSDHTLLKFRTIILYNFR